MNKISSQNAGIQLQLYNLILLIYLTNIIYIVIILI